jgi:L-methionine (R)-S-oxide reductase
VPHAEYTDDLPLAEIPARLAALIDGERDFLANTANAASLIGNAMPGLNWCGFYFYRGGELVLGPFLGKPACVRIALKRGVCGAAARERRTQLVADVHEFPGHIACDAASAAELVVPLVDAQDRLLGVLDLDSPEKGRFSEEEARVMEAAMRVLVTGSDTPWFIDGE